MKDDFMGYDGFREICYQQKIRDEDDIDTLCFVLHCLGIALNYREDSRLRETSVLKPEWVTEGIYTILNAKTLADRQGELHLNELKKLLPKSLSEKLIINYKSF
jgi:internalin A